MNSSDISNDIPQQHASTPPAQYNLDRLAGLRGIPALLAADGFVQNGQERSAQTTGGPLTRECSSGSESGESASQSSTLSPTAPPNNLRQILPPLNAAQSTGSHPLRRTYSEIRDAGDARAVRPRTSVPQEGLSVESIGDESVGYSCVRQGDLSAIVLIQEIRERDVDEVLFCVVVNNRIFLKTVRLQ